VLVSAPLGSMHTFRACSVLYLEPNTYARHVVDLRMQLVERRP
jgi:hypothetical protein